MRHAVSVALTLPMILTGCAAGSDPDRPVTAACADLQCFRESQIRDVEFLGNQTLIAYVGPQRCAYRMDLDGDYCEYAMGPMIHFEPARRSQILSEASIEQRICLNDRPYVVDPFTLRCSDVVARTDRRRTGLPPRSGRGASDVTGSDLDRGNQCRVAKITLLSDDELLELYADKGAQSPLPPVGSGQISVPGADGQQATDSTEGNAEDTSPSDGAPNN